MYLSVSGSQAIAPEKVTRVERVHKIDGLLQERR